MPNTDQPTVHLFTYDRTGAEVSHRTVTPHEAAEILGRIAWGGAEEWEDDLADRVDRLEEGLALPIETAQGAFEVGTADGFTLVAIPEGSPLLAAALGNIVAPVAAQPFEVIAEGTYDEETDEVTYTSSTLADIAARKATGRYPVAEATAAHRKATDPTRRQH